MVRSCEGQAGSSKKLQVTAPYPKCLGPKDVLDFGEKMLLFDYSLQSKTFPPVERLLVRLRKYMKFTSTRKKIYEIYKFQESLESHKIDKADPQGNTSSNDCWGDGDRDRG